MAVLNWQKDTREYSNNYQQDQKNRERQMLNEQWKSEESNENEVKRQQFVLNRERQQELTRHNMNEQQLRDMESKKEKDRDTHMLNNILNRESEMERLENEEKNRRKTEVVELQKHYMREAEDKQAEEKMMEELIAMEQEKQWKMREDKWTKEDQARINLMKNVYDSRLQTVELRGKQKDEQKWMNNYEKDAMAKELERQRIAHEEAQMKQALQKKNHQTDILMQVGERDRVQRRTIQEQMYEERSAKLAEIEYLKKIKAEKEVNDQMLNTVKSQLGQGVSQRPF